MEKFNKNENPTPTIYSMVSTHYYILELIYEFLSWSCITQCDPYYGLIGAPQIICNQQKHE